MRASRSRPSATTSADSRPGRCPSCLRRRKAAPNSAGLSRSLLARARAPAFGWQAFVISARLRPAARCTACLAARQPTLRVGLLALEQRDLARADGLTGIAARAQRRERLLRAIEPPGQQSPFGAGERGRATRLGRSVRERERAVVVALRAEQAEELEAARAVVGVPLEPDAVPTRRLVELAEPVEHHGEI